MMTGWSKADVLSLTPSEASIVMEEAEALEDEREIRLMEAYHAPKRFSERKKKRAPVDAWMDLISKFDPKRAAVAEKVLAAKRFMEKQRGGKRS